MNDYNVNKLRTDSIQQRKEENYQTEDDSVIDLLNEMKKDVNYDENKNFLFKEIRQPDKTRVLTKKLIISDLNNVNDKNFNDVKKEKFFKFLENQKNQHNDIKKQNNLNKEINNLQQVTKNAVIPYKDNSILSSHDILNNINNLNVKYNFGNRNCSNTNLLSTNRMSIDTSTINLVNTNCIQDNKDEKLSNQITHKKKLINKKFQRILFWILAIFAWLILAIPIILMILGVVK